MKIFTPVEQFFCSEIRGCFWTPHDSLSSLTMTPFIFSITRGELCSKFGGNYLEVTGQLNEGHWTILSDAGRIMSHFYFLVDWTWTRFPDKTQVFFQTSDLSKWNTGHVLVHPQGQKSQSHIWLDAFSENTTVTCCEVAPSSSGLCCHPLVVPGTCMP